MQSHSQQPNKRFHREWRWLGFIWLAVAALPIVLLWIDHKEVETKERNYLEHEARILQNTLALQIGGANQALNSVTDDLQHWQGVPDRLALASGRLQALTGSVIGIHAMVLLDASGTVIASSHNEIFGRNFSKLNYYLIARQAALPDMLIVPPPFQTEEGRWVIALARILQGPDGGLGGVVAAMLDSEQLLTLLQPVRHSPDMIVSLLHGDGVRFMAILNKEGTPDEYGVNIALPGSLFMRHLKSGFRKLS